MKPALLDQVARYYESKLATHGATPAGVDWSSEQSQIVRFEQFAGLVGDRDASVTDYGCGYGAYLDFLRGRGHAGAYTGFDAAPAMIAAATARHAGDARATFVNRREALGMSDFTIASGILNVRLSTPADEWAEYVKATIGDLASLSRRGFGFNVLTSYSDADKQRPDLYYADPRDMLDYCLRRWPRRVALIHDYGLYEFTVTVRL
jgi:SAM-dependent methyltransferase